MPILSIFTSQPITGLNNYFSASVDHTYQAKILQGMLTRYNWTRVGIIYTSEPESVACTSHFASFSKGTPLPQIFLFASALLPLLSTRLAANYVL